jgi:hypothetical protein
MFARLTPKWYNQEQQQQQQRLLMQEPSSSHMETLLYTNSSFASCMRSCPYGCAGAGSNLKGP